MKKYSKKIALILVLSLVLAAAIPALAADETEINGEYKPPRIKVVLPSNTSAVINPYALPVEIGQTDAEGNVTTLYGTVEGQQIVTAKPLCGYNYSTVPLKVGATVKGEKPDGSNFNFASENPAYDSTANSGLVYFEAKTAKTAVDLENTANSIYVTGKDTSDTAYHVGLDVAKVIDELNDPTGWEDGFYGEGADNQVLVKLDKEVTKKGMVSIKEGLNGNPQTGSVFVARLNGNIVKSPKVKWETTDKIKVTVTWILEPDLED